MAERLKLIRGEWDSLCCPLPKVEVYHDYNANDSGETLKVYEQVCGATLHVNASMTCDLACFENTELVDLFAEGKWANIGSWTVECENGHVLGMSTYDGAGGDAPLFNIHWLPFELPPTEATATSNPVGEVL